MGPEKELSKCLCWINAIVWVTAGSEELMDFSLSMQSNSRNLRDESVHFAIFSIFSISHLQTFPSSLWLISSQNPRSTTPVNWLPPLGSLYTLNHCHLVKSSQLIRTQHDPALDSGWLLHLAAPPTRQGSNMLLYDALLQNWSTKYTI